MSDEDQDSRDAPSPPETPRTDIPQEDWAKLVPVSSRYTQEFYLLKYSPVVVGRASASDLAITSGHLSRRHAEVRYNPKSRSYFVLDFSSKNGTFINKKKVASHDLADGDVVQFHREIFRFELLEPGDGADSNKPPAEIEFELASDSGDAGPEEPPVELELEDEA
ncbi:MAG: FHA domain-containing protein [Planctomycetes bacterium]|nr:FHA domain-containing protein [Planctomycetota bacterium]